MYYRQTPRFRVWCGLGMEQSSSTVCKPLNLVPCRVDIQWCRSKFAVEPISHLFGDIYMTNALMGRVARVGQLFESSWQNVKYLRTERPVRAHDLAIPANSCVLVATSKHSNPGQMQCEQ
jgi:hypothetical protein